MDAPSGKPRRYKWPWFVLAGVLLFVLLTILWMSLEIRTVEQERNPNPLPPAGPAR
jgi:hypothetical protein